MPIDGFLTKKKVPPHRIDRKREKTIQSENSPLKARTVSLVMLQDHSAICNALGCHCLLIYSRATVNLSSSAI